MQRAIAIPRRDLSRLHWNQDRVDVVMAVILMGLSLAMAVNARPGPDVIGVSLLVLQTLPIAWRRRNPMRILYITGSAITLYSILGYSESIAYLGIFVAFYTVAANEPRRRATIAAAITAAGIFISFMAYGLLGHMPSWSSNLTSAYLSYGVAWLIGDNLRVRRAYTKQLEDRAIELEQGREDKAAQAVSEERQRIARELHDVVAHYVSVMVVQAAGARRIVDKDPESAKGALEAVEAAGRTALTEMRRMLEVLRADDPGMGPQPGMGEIERLIGNVRDAGLPVQFTLEGSACCLPAGMDLAAYRIVQEALTNTVKHGGKATARVAVRYTPDTLEIEVVDDGRGAAAPLLAGDDGHGHGLIGMRERVALFGGRLEAGPVLTGGYRVFARMPIEPDDAARTRSEREASAAAIKSGAEQDRRDHAQSRERPRRSLGLFQPDDKPRPAPPMMVRVLPPHPTEQSRPRGRREREGEL